MKDLKKFRFRGFREQPFYIFTSQKPAGEYFFAILILNQVKNQF